MSTTVSERIAELLHTLAYEVASGEATPEMTAAYLHRMARALTHPGYMDEDGIERRAFALKDITLRHEARH